jgi:RNA polymerase sigma-70 factor (ECF subfamily)
MSDASRTLLRELLVGGYGDLKMRLTKAVGSADLASDALQDTWLKLETAKLNGHLQRPKSYLFRIAYNIAVKRRQNARKAISLDDAKNTLDIPSDAPGPLEIVEGFSDVALLKEAIRDLTDRQRDILFSSKLENVPIADLATRYGVSERWIALELRRALVHCAQRLERKIIQRFSPSPRQGSKDREPIE